MWDKGNGEGGNGPEEERMNILVPAKPNSLPFTARNTNTCTANRTLSTNERACVPEEMSNSSSTHINNTRYHLFSLRSRPSTDMTRQRRVSSIRLVLPREGGRVVATPLRRPNVGTDASGVSIVRGAVPLLHAMRGCVLFSLSLLLGSVRHSLAFESSACGLYYLAELVEEYTG